MDTEVKITLTTVLDAVHQAQVLLDKAFSLLARLEQRETPNNVPWEALQRDITAAFKAAVAGGPPDMNVSGDVLDGVETDALWLWGGHQIKVAYDPGLLTFRAIHVADGEIAARPTTATKTLALEIAKHVVARKAAAALDDAQQVEEVVTGTNARSEKQRARMAAMTFEERSAMAKKGAATRRLRYGGRRGRR